MDPINTFPKKEFYKKLIALRKEIGAISKDAIAKAAKFQYKYFDINTILKHLDPLLEKHELLLIQPIVDNKVTSIIMDSNGNRLESSISLDSCDEPPQNMNLVQAFGSKITYFRRYTLLCLLALQAEDDDGHLAAAPPPQVATSSSSFSSAKNDDKPWLDEGTENFIKAVEYLRNGGEIRKLRNKFKISKKIAALLEEATNDIPQ